MKQNHTTCKSKSNQAIDKIINDKEVEISYNFAPNRLLCNLENN